MATVKVAAPKDFTGGSIAGLELTPDENGFVFVDSQFLPVLADHGFHSDLETITNDRAKLVNQFTQAARTVVESLPTELLSDLKALPQESQDTVWFGFQELLKNSSKVGPAPVPGNLTPPAPVNNDPAPAKKSAPAAQ